MGKGIGIRWGFGRKRPPSPRVMAGGCAALLLLALAGGCGGGSSQRLRDAGFDKRNPVGVPAEAKLVQHSDPKVRHLLNPNSWFAADDVTFQPSVSGRVWVVDELNGRVAYKTTLRTGDQLVVSPRENQVLLNRAYVYSRRLPDEHGWLVYFLPEESPAAAAASQPK